MKKSLNALGLLVTMALVGCGNAEQKGAEHAGDSTVATTDGSDKPQGDNSAKPSAPVVIEGQVSASSATLKIGFLSDATDVKVDVWGVDGLTVTSSTMTANGQPVSQTRFGQGEYVGMNVSFTAPSTVQTNLAVRVRGLFGGKVRERVQSFTVNAGAPPASTGPGEVRTGPDGTPVRVMKAE